MKIDAAQSAALAAASQAQPQPGTKKPPKEAPPPPPQEVAGATEVRAASLEPSKVQRQLSVTFDEDNRVIYQFYNQDTGELVQQVPSEEVLRIARNIADLLERSTEITRGAILDIDT